MNLSNVVQQLVAEDDLEKWHKIPHSFAEKEEAKPLWLRRMVQENKILFHPKMQRELEDAGWQPSDTHLQMVWANILATKPSDPKRKDFYRIKRILIKRYDEDWWETVYLWIKHAYAAHARLSKLHGGGAVETLVSRTLLGQAHAHDELLAARKMLPESE